MDSSPDTPSQSILHRTPEPESRFVPELARSAEAVDTDRTESDDTDPLDDVHQAIGHLSDLDPADAAGPGAAVADILSRALEEEDL